MILWLPDRLLEGHRRSALDPASVYETRLAPPKQWPSLGGGRGGALLVRPC